MKVSPAGVCSFGVRRVIIGGHIAVDRVFTDIEEDLIRGQTVAAHHRFVEPQLFRLHGNQRPFGVVDRHVNHVDILRLDARQLGFKVLAAARAWTSMGMVPPFFRNWVRNAFARPTE